MSDTVSVARRRRPWVGHPIVIGAWVCPACGVAPPAHTNGHACAACGTVPGRGLELDHCNATGRPRGYLCHSCNVTLGLVQAGRLGSGNYPLLVAYLARQTMWGAW